eukprot:TRINITY_DN103942_c0_g1_i1.p1 TRINITY_DN103942_c0_g1~~TRINITY_DN103942_c0_g1_i1.p1  ORF type:complete len:241 (+),score=24.50 TRINITY_DN103942_c0_g1_i1:206-928(+)
MAIREEARMQSFKNKSPEPPLPRILPTFFWKLRGAELEAALPYVYELYRSKTLVGSAHAGQQRSRQIGSILHLRVHSIPSRGCDFSIRFGALLIAAMVWTTVFSRALQLRCVVCALLYSFSESAFTLGERGVAYTTLAHFVGVILYTPILLDGYAELLSDHPVAYVACFPLNVWLLELLVGLGIVWMHGHNVAWCYADYADTFFFGQARAGHAPAWLGLGCVCYWLYPWLQTTTASLTGI